MASIWEGEVIANTWFVGILVYNRFRWAFICPRYEVMFVLPRMCGPLSDRELTCHADQFQDLSLCDVLGPVPWHPSGKFT